MPVIGKTLEKYKLSLYNDRGELLIEDVPLKYLHPAINPTIKKIAYTVMRTSVANLDGIEKSLKKGEVGGQHCKIPGKELDLPLVQNASSIAEKVKEILQIRPDDDTNVEVIDNGKVLTIQVPRERLEIAASHDGARVAAAMALGHAIIQQFDLKWWHVPILKAALIGRYCSSVNFLGANVQHLLKEGVVLEGPGHAFRTILVNHFAEITGKNSINAAALAGITELLGHLESGDCYGPYELYALLAYAYQCLNGNNLVYELVKENRNGTVGDVVTDLISRAIKDGVISEKETLPSGYRTFSMKDPYLWNAYTCAGTLSAVLLNVAASRAAQSLTATMAYFNDMIELETGLPSADALKLHGIGVVWTFYSHSIYGGGGPGIFHGDDPIIRNSFGGFMIPCGAAAMALDAGTQTFSPERTSSLVGKVFGRYPFMKEPIKYIAKGVEEVRGKF